MFLAFVNERDMFYEKEEDMYHLSLLSHFHYRHIIYSKIHVVKRRLFNYTHRILLLERSIGFNTWISISVYLYILDIGTSLFLKRPWYLLIYGIPTISPIIFPIDYIIYHSLNIVSSTVLLWSSIKVVSHKAYIYNNFFSDRRLW